MITRTPLRADVHHALLGLILQGSLPPGARLKDTELAQRLGVSRTPVREALLRLEREGFIASQMGQGFSVQPLREEEVREVYPLVALLEGEAMASLPMPGQDKLRRLEELSEAMGSGGEDPLPRIELDQRWHRTLLEGCANAHLFRILDELKRILFRYEYAFMQVNAWVSESASEHREIAQAIASDRKEQAISLLRNHWEKSMQSVLSRIQATRS